MGHIIDVVIPAFNEEDAVGLVIDDIPKDLIRDIVVVDNNSTDQTAKVALEHNATVLEQPIQGYGAACLQGIDYLEQKTEQPDIVVFLDADYSDYPEEMASLTDPIIRDKADFVLGSRTMGHAGKGALMPQQKFGNALATLLLARMYGYRFTDLGPFRAIKFDELIALQMEDMNYGWTVEMQIKAAKNKLRCHEVPVNYRRRIGTSKVSGTVKGSALAGYKIITTLLKHV